MQYFSYLFFRFWVAVVAIIPFPLLYGISNVIAWMMQYLIGYRSTVITKNLNLVFPTLSDSELSNIKKSAYRNLTDIILESFKGFSMSRDNLMKRYTVDKPAYMDELYASGKNVVVYGSHLGNWEWATYTFPLYYPFDIIGMIKPVKNKYINAYTNRKRCSTGTKVIDIYNAADRSILIDPENPFLLVYIADQNPSDDKQSIVVDFFGIKTHCLHGAEKMAKKNDWPVVHFQTSRVSRGHYVLSPKIISMKPKENAPSEITQLYFDQLETLIKRDPGAWLWSHKRWKRNITY